MTSLPFNVNETPYEMFIDISYTHIINNTTIHCITKDTLLDVLDNINSIENSDLYDYYLFGKLNTSCPFPTWDVDLALVNSTTDTTTLLNVMKNIKEMGLTKNINFDLKYLTDINIIATGYNNPDISYNIVEKVMKYDISTNEYILSDRTKIYKVNGKKMEFFTDFVYYTPLLIKKKGENILTSEGLQFINNSILPNSNLMGSCKFEPRALRRGQ
jgi:hypothetical protein